MEKSPSRRQSEDPKDLKPAAEILENAALNEILEVDATPQEARRVLWKLDFLYILSPLRN